MRKLKFLSIVTPCYNEEQNVNDMYDSIKGLFNTSLKGYDWELIFSENGSSDRSYERIKNIADKDKRVRIVKLSRNFEYEGGICSGLYYAQGDAVVVLDCDLQDPVNLIPEFIKYYDQGYNVVFGVRKTRQEGLIKRSAYKLFYFIFSNLSTHSFPRDAGEFCLMDKRVYKIIANLKEQHKFIRALRYWTGFRQIGVPYDRKERNKGETKHPVSEMFGLALDGLLSFSAFPLRLIFYLGLFVTSISFIGIIYAFAWKYINPSKIPGYAALLTTILFLGGVQMLSIGVIGEYIYRIYNEVRDRPYYIVDHIINIDLNPDINSEVKSHRINV